MKQLKGILSLAIAMFCFTAVNAKSTKTTANKVVADTVYYCPMKCEGDKTYEKAGKCAVCNMKLKPMSKTAAITFQCPMKCEGDKTYTKEGKCPVCNMALKKVNTGKVKNNYEG
jgi:Cu2+-exporting ATPase